MEASGNLWEALDHVFIENDSKFDEYSEQYKTLLK